MLTLLIMKLYDLTGKVIYNLEKKTNLEMTLQAMKSIDGWK
jgi:hypothetical protein